MEEYENNWWFHAKKAFVRKVIPLRPKQKILDVGSGRGGMVGLLENYGKVIAIEPDSANRKVAGKKGLVLENARAEALPFKDGKFDMVCFFDVLYHKNINDILALGEANRVLKKDGYLLVTDSAVKFLSGPHDKKFAARERYSKAELVEKVKKVGFEIEYATYYFFFVFPFFASTRIIDKILASLGSKMQISSVSHTPPILEWLLIKLCRLEASFIPKTIFPIGSSLMIKARKGGRG